MCKYEGGYVMLKVTSAYSVQCRVQGENDQTRITLNNSCIQGCMRKIFKKRGTEAETKLFARKTFQITRKLRDNRTVA